MANEIQTQKELIGILNNLKINWKGEDEKSLILGSHLAEFKKLAQGLEEWEKEKDPVKKQDKLDILKPTINLFEKEKSLIQTTINEIKDLSEVATGQTLATFEKKQKTRPAHYGKGLDDNVKGIQIVGIKDFWATAKGKIFEEAQTQIKNPFSWGALAILILGKILEKFGHVDDELKREMEEFAQGWNADGKKPQLTASKDQFGQLWFKGWDPDTKKVQDIAENVDHNAITDAFNLYLTKKNLNLDKDLKDFKIEYKKGADAEIQFGASAGSQAIAQVQQQQKQQKQQNTQSDPSAPSIEMVD